MYICICNAVTDRAIRRAVSEGASSVREVSLMTGCGTQCGSCVQQVRDILQESRASAELAPSWANLQVVSVG